MTTKADRASYIVKFCKLSSDHLQMHYSRTIHDDYVSFICIQNKKQSMAIVRISSKSDLFNSNSQEKHLKSPSGMIINSDL